MMGAIAGWSRKVVILTKEQRCRSHKLQSHKFVQAQIGKSKTFSLQETRFRFTPAYNFSIRLVRNLTKLNLAT
jgi:hypothetical protein